MNDSVIIRVPEGGCPGTVRYYNVQNVEIGIHLDRSDVVQFNRAMLASGTSDDLHRWLGISPFLGVEVYASWLVHSWMHYVPDNVAAEVLETSFYLPLHNPLQGVIYWLCYPKASPTAVARALLKPHVRRAWLIASAVHTSCQRLFAYVRGKKVRDFDDLLCGSKIMWGTLEMLLQKIGYLDSSLVRKKYNTVYPTYRPRIPAEDVEHIADALWWLMADYVVHHYPNSTLAKENAKRLYDVLQKIPTTTNTGC